MRIVNIAMTESINAIPTHFSVAVIMQRCPALFNDWCEYHWQAIGITVTGNAIENQCQAQLVRNSGDIQQYLYSSFNVNLYIDECESYYHNLMSPTPHCYVVARLDENDTPVPFLVSMSFDEAHAYQEGDEQIYAIPIPPELYRWAEAFVLAHYAPEKRVKRKRQNWKNQSQKRGVS